ncbi:hypothetical protein EJ08DRAFT_722180 [Tothia fuscella]|uniref:BTB domain-containing protein n=1 Tax=Tothia fuscella TaxID=1048955 RepID=A0A9P4U1R7_9PEZI|nr:hypothetical protein EJ08DRAFT_722180 [Tothia fuscella]
MATTLSDALRPLLSSGDFSDMTVVCQGKTFKLHKNIVCGQVEFFRNAFDGRFAEAESHEVKLVDDELCAVQAMFEYLYTRVYNNQSDVEASAIILHAHVYSLADKYNIQGLKDMAGNEFSEAIVEEWNTPEFVTTVKIVYESTPPSDRVLRDMVTRVSAKHIKVLINKDGTEDGDDRDVETGNDFEEMMLGQAQFGLDLAKYSAYGEVGLRGRRAKKRKVANLRGLPF